MVKCKRLKKTIATAVIGAFLFQLTIGLPAQSEEEILNQFQKAKNRYANGQYVNAKTRLERVISIIIEKNITRNYILGGCYLLLGAIYEKEGSVFLAEENYNKAKDYGITKVEGVDLATLDLYKKYVLSGGVIEGPPVTPPKKKFPWLLVAGGVVVVGVLVYFLVLKPKKKYQLTVNLTDGVEGNPGTGIYQYKKGETVAYSYQRKAGYSQLQVYLDDQPAETSGQVIMDRDHTLTVTAAANQVNFVTDTDSISIPEGGTAAFHVRLSAEPGQDVPVTVERISGDTGIHVAGDPNLTFTPSDWMNPKEVRLQADEDEDTQDGTAVFQVKATGIDNIPVKTINVLVQDNDKLSVKITEPQEGAVVNDEVIVKVDAAGKYEVTRVEFFIDGSGKKTDRSAPYKYTWNTGTVADGPHTIKAVAYDSANQSAEDEIPVIVSNRTYILTVVKGEGVSGAPDSGKTSHYINEVISYSYSLQEGYTTLKVELDGVSVPASGTIKMNGNHKLEAAAVPPPGQYILTVTRGAGVAGTPESGTTPYNEGTQVPYSYSLQEGYTGLTVRLDGNDVPPAGTIDMDRNHTLAAAAEGLSILTDTDALAICEEGQEVFKVKLSGKPSSDVNVTVSWFSGDNDISVVSGGNLTFTPDNAEEWQTVTLQAGKDDDQSDDTATIQVASGQIPGPKNIDATEYDLDLHPAPTVFISIPKDGDSVSDEVIIRAEVGEANTVEEVEFLVDGESVRIDRNSPFQYTWSTRDVPLGSHRLKVIASDRCGRTGENEITVNLTDSPPEIRDFKILSGEPLSGTANIYVLAYDYRAIKLIRLLLDGQTVGAWEGEPRSQVSYTFNLDTTAYANGSYTLRVVAVDTADQESQPAAIPVEIQNE